LYYYYKNKEILKKLIYSNIKKMISIKISI